MKKVAIILVNYNGVRDTIDCITSIEQCKFETYEIIVIDNCSIDSSYEELVKEKNNHNFTLIKADENKGFSAGNNIGIKYAIENLADYILLLNNDTVVQDDFIERLIDGFEYSDKCGATIGKILFYSNPDVIWYAGGSLNKRTARTEHFDYGKNDNPNDSEMKKISFATGCCVCLKREVVEQIGMMDEDFFLYEEDAEYSYRITSAGYDIVYNPNSVIYHKVSASTGNGSPLSQYYTVRNKYLFIRKKYRAINKFLAYNYCTLQFIFRCIKREMKFKFFWRGLKGFLKKEIGKNYTI